MKFVTPKLASVIVVLCATLLAQTNAAPPAPMAANMRARRANARD